MTDVESVAVWNDETQELTIFAVNRDLNDDIALSCDVGSFEGYRVLSRTVLESSDLKAVNGPDAQRVAPAEQAGTAIDGRILTANLHKASWNVIRLGVKK